MKIQTKQLERKLADILFLSLLILISIQYSPPLSVALEIKTQDLMLKIQEKYDPINSVRCKFVQKIYNRLNNTVMTSKGILYIKKPNLMRWEYITPEKRVFILNEKKYIWFEPGTHEITEKPIGEDPQSMPFLFLSQKVRLSNIFTVGKIKKGDNELLTIELIPKKGSRDIRTIFLYIDNDYNIMGLSFNDMYENKTEIFFSKQEYNIELQDNLFTVPN